MAPQNFAWLRPTEAWLPAMAPRGPRNRARGWPRLGGQPRVVGPRTQPGTGCVAPEPMLESVPGFCHPTAHASIPVRCLRTRLSKPSRSTLRLRKPDIAKRRFKMNCGHCFENTAWNGTNVTCGIETQPVPGWVGTSRTQGWPPKRGQPWALLHGPFGAAVPLRGTGPLRRVPLGEGCS